METLPPFSCIFFLCASANSSSAMFVGSFSVRKPSMPFFFFFGGMVCFVPVVVRSVMLVLNRLLEPEPEPDCSLGLRFPLRDAVWTVDVSTVASVPLSLLVSVAAVEGRAIASPSSIVLFRTASFGTLRCRAGESRSTIATDITTR